MQKTCFMRLIHRNVLPTDFRPILLEFSKHGGHGVLIFGVRSEIPRFSALASGRQQLLAQNQVPRKALEDVLPRTRRVRKTYFNRLVMPYRTDDIGNQTIFGPVAPADPVARARCRAERVGVAGEERLSVTLDYEFRCRLGCAVRIVPA